MLEKHNIDDIHAPVDFPGLLQPLDLSINKPGKDFLRGDSRSGMLTGYMTRGKISVTHHVCLKQTKPLAAQWMIKWNEYILTHPEIKNGFRVARITQLLQKVMYAGYNVLLCTCYVPIMILQYMYDVL